MIACFMPTKHWRDPRSVPGMILPGAGREIPGLQANIFDGNETNRLKIIELGRFFSLYTILALNLLISIAEIFGAGQVNKDACLLHLQNREQGRFKEKERNPLS